MNLLYCGLVDGDTPQYKKFVVVQFDNEPILSIKTKIMKACLARDSRLAGVARFISDSGRIFKDRPGLFMVAWEES